MSIWIAFGDVTFAQSTPDSCDIAHVQPKFPHWSGEGFEKHYIDSGEATQDEQTVVESKVSEIRSGLIDPTTQLSYLQCGAQVDRFNAPPIEYKLVRSTGQYSRVTFTFRHMTTFLGCNGYSKQFFTDHPQVYEDFLDSYTKPGVMLNNSWLTRIEANGLLSLDNNPRDWKIREADSVPVDQVFNTLRSGLQTQNEVSAHLSSWYQLKVIPVEGNRLVAVSYRQLEVTVTASNQPGQGPASLQDANDIAKASLIFGIGQLLDFYRDFEKYKAMFYSAMLNGFDGINDVSDVGLLVGDLSSIALEASPFTSFALSFVSWAKTVLPSSSRVVSHLFDDMVMTSPYLDQELRIAPEIESALRSRHTNYPSGTQYRLLAMSWTPEISQLVIGGDKFQQNATLQFKFGLVGQQPLLSWNSTLVSDQADTLFMGLTLRSSIPSGCYLLSAVGPGNTGAQQIAGNFIWINGSNGSQNYVPPQSLTLSIPGSGSSSPDRTCSNPVSLLTQHANLFNGLNCGGDITWFSAHPENGPSANSTSLYVPTNSVVKVSSQDNGGGETACFTSTQTDLGAWRNKIQWAQLVPGGACPVVTADGYVIHTNQGDFRVSNGQTWDNTQHNRQIWGFDRQGSVHLKINHVNGAQRCWDESKTAQQLQNDGDWWIQTRSIVIGSGYCPGMSGQLEVYSLANFQGGRHDIRAGNQRTYPDNDLKYSLRFTAPGMSVKLTNASGRTRCWNTNIANLQDHEDYWHRTTQIEVFGNDVCPKPVEVPAGATFAPGSNVKYTYYEYIAPMVGLPIPNVWTPVSTGYAGNFAINQVPHRDNDFAIRFESCLTVPTTGSYTFYTTSDDGSKLYINGQNIVDNDGYHSSSEKSGTVNLTAGVHSIAVDFFEGGVEQMLGVAWQGPNFAKQWMPNQQLAMTGCSWELKKQLPTIKPDMFAIAKSGLTAGTTGVKLLTGSSNFSTVQGTYPTYVEEDTRQNYAWAYELADYNFDGTLDIYAFKKTGTGSGMTELHVLNGASNYRSFALQTPTTLGATGYDYVWDFELGDYDKDGRLDAFAINKKYTGQRKVELHILKGAGNFQTWCAHIVTALPELSSLDYWDFELADYDGDKNLDLFAFNKTGTASGKIELSILKGPTFSSIAVQQQLPISTIFSATNRQLEFADYSGDGVQDLYVVDSVGGTGVVEVSVWDGNGTFQNRLASLLTAQPNVSDGGTRWLFRFARLKGQVLGASLSDESGEIVPITEAPADNVLVHLLFLPLISN